MSTVRLIATPARHFSGRTVTKNKSLWMGVALVTPERRLFFSGDTWLFYADDTLIRLFPLKLWSDAFIFMGIFTLAGALVCIFAIGRLSQK